MNEAAGDGSKTTITTDHQHQAANWRWMVVVLAVVLIATFCLFGFYVMNTEEARSESRAIANCRGKTEATLSSAQVSNLIAFNDLVVGLGDPSRESLDTELERIKETAQELRAASDARVAFEAHPTGKC